MGSVCHVVHSSAFGVLDVDALFLCSGGPGAVSIKGVPGHVTLIMCFFIRWDPWVTYCISVHPGRGMSTHYFSCRGGPDAVF
jgi:hypothetical protein